MHPQDKLRGIKMIDKLAFRSLTCGLYIIGAHADGRDAGCVVNTVLQVTSSPAQVSVAVNKDNATAGFIAKAGRFTAACLTEDAPMELIGRFGFHSSADVDKFDGVAFERDGAGAPYVAEHVAARFSARVVQTVDVGTHLLFIGEVEESEAFGGDPMSYAYYHKVKGGTSPPKASSFEGDVPTAAEEAATERAAAEEAKAEGVRYAWRCTICGHIEYVDELPDDFSCPLCGMGKDMFERIEV